MFSQSGVLLRAAVIASTACVALSYSQAAVAAPADNVPCRADTLATAIANAGEGDTISLTPLCVYHLTQGLPTISQDLTIAGNGAMLERSAKAPAFTIFSVIAGTLTIDDTELRNGDNAVTVNGTTAAVVVNSSAFVDNHGSEGGAIYSNTGVSGPVVNKSTFIANQSTDAGGAIYNNSALGGVFITGSTFTGNVATGDGGAIWDFSATGEEVDNSRLDNNRASDGGGVWFSPDSGMSFSHDTISGNVATADGGGIEAFNFFSLDLRDNTISRNHAADGGGLYAIGGEVETIEDSDFLANTANDGGAIYTGLIGSRDTLTNSKLADNRARTDGGGVYYDSTEDPFGENWSATGSQITGNTAGSAGGGIYNTENATATVTSSLVQANEPTNCAPPGSVTGCTN
ncbi:MAG TPA: hypothetical protein VGM14_23485 [Streptosporangiaceae bacterium]